MAVSLLQQPSAANNAQFVAADRSGLGHLKPSLRSVITEHTAGDRRLQDACDTQRSALNFCLPTVECVDCYESAIAAATSDFVFCLELENNLCAISASSSCSSCGCETEAVDYYQCIVNEQSCPEIINCADVACDAVYNDAVSCVKTVGTSCLSCADNAFYQLDESLSCPDREDALCPAFHENCGCDQCADKVEAWIACLYTQSLVCANFACSAPETPSPAANSSSGGSGGGGHAVIWAVVVIVVVIIIIAVTVYLVRRKKPDHGPTSNKDASTSSAPMNEHSETTSTAPSANLQYAHSPPPQQRHQTPVTASRQSDDDYSYDRRRPTDVEGSAASTNNPPSLQSTGGGQLLVNKDQCGAAEKYRQAALQLKPGARATSALRASAVKKFAVSGVECAKQHAATGQYAKAKEMLNAILGDEMAPNDKPAQKLLKDLEDPDRYNPSLTPAHAENVSKVKKMLRQATQLEEIAAFDEAKAMYNQVLSIDSTNTAAQRGLEGIEKHISQHLKAARDHTRAKMLADVDRLWETPVPHFAQVKPLSAAGGELPISGSSAALKLRSLVIPRIALTETPVPEALRYLAKQSAEQDPSPAEDGSRGVNFVWSGNEATAKPVTLELRNSRLGDALRAICDMSGTRYRVEGNLVTVSTGGSGGAMETRQFKVPPGFLSTAASVALNDAAPGADPFAASPSETARPKIGRTDARSYFEQQGIPFPEGSRAAYSPGQNLLTITNTADNLDTIAAIVDSLATSGQKQVLVQAILLKTSETILRDIGGDFLIDAFNVGGDRVFASGGTFGNSSISAVGSSNNSGIGSRSFTSVEVPFNVTSNPVTMGLRSSYDLDTSLGIDQWLDLSTRGGQTVIQPRAPYVGAVAGAFTDPRFQALFRGLDQKKGVDLSVANSLILKSGQKASSFSGRKFFYPTEFDPPQIPQSTGGGSSAVLVDINTGTILAAASSPPPTAPVTPATPNSFQERDIGASLEVEATVGEDGHTVDLNLSILFSEFDGFINYGAPIIDPQNPGVRLTDNQIIQPVFSRYAEATQVLVYDGATIAIGGLTEGKEETIADKTPILSSIPVIGRFFKSDVRRSTKTAVVYFVSVKIIDPSGASVNAAGRAAEAAASGVALDTPGGEPALPR